LISSLGYGSENVFEFTEIDLYKKANLHISIDASSSMGGNKWNKTITNVVALCKAIDMIANLEVQVSFRSTVDQGGYSNHGRPLVVMAYDSRVDKFSKVKQLFPYLHASGTTPEGLCFDAIMKNFVPMSTDMDSYFLNISDGEPYFATQNEDGGFSYYGTNAEDHTKKMVNQMRGMGIGVLSYFVNDYGDTEPNETFKRMYGRDAKAIDVTNVSQIAKTMNQLFLQKSK
jgi:hypothetical protein